MHLEVVLCIFEFVDKSVTREFGREIEEGAISVATPERTGNVKEDDGAAIVSAMCLDDVVVKCE